MTLEDYKHVCKIAAKIVDKFGDRYMPIFKRTLDEMKIAETQDNLKEIALIMARE